VRNAEKTLARRLACEERTEAQGSQKKRRQAEHQRVTFLLQETTKAMLTGGMIG